jgi:mannose/fructose/N-acetylgalactosamine-specific phosphotransferase system component IIC
MEFSMFSRNAILYAALFIAGLVLLLWGANAFDSFSSEVSRTFDGAPTNKSIALLVGGGLLAAVGIAGLIAMMTRRRS